MVLAVFPLKPLSEDSLAGILASFLMDELSARLSVSRDLTVLGYHHAGIMRIYEENSFQAASYAGAGFFITGSFRNFKQSVCIEIELWKTAGGKMLSKSISEPISAEPGVSSSFAAMLPLLTQSLYQAMIE